MFTHRRLLPFLCLALLPIGCSQVYIREPVATTTSEELREDLEGAWILDDSVLHIAFDAKGIGETAMIERSEEDETFRLVPGEIAAVERDDRYFLSFRRADEEEEEADPIYYWSEYRPTEESDLLVVWYVDVDRFEEAVAADELQGAIERGKHSVTVKIESETEQILQFLEETPEAIATREPIVLKRVR